MSAGTMWLGSYLTTINESLLSLAVLANFGRLNITHLIMIRKINFLSLFIYIKELYAA